MEKRIVMKPMTHLNFIIGLMTLILLFAGIGLKFYSYRSGDGVLIAATVLGTIHWIWSIKDVFTHQNPLSQSRIFWIIMVVALPPIGGMCYYLFSKTVKL